MDSQEWRGENSPGLNQRGQPPPPQQQPPPPQSPSTPGLYMYGGGQQGAGPSHHHQQLQQQHHNHPQHQLHHRYEPGSSGGGHHHHPHPLRFPHHRSLEQLQNPEPVSPYGPTYYDLDQNRLYTPRNTGSMMNPGNVGLPYGHPHYHPHHNPHHPLPPPHHNLHHHNPSPQQQQQQQQTHHPPPPPPPLQTQADPSSKYPPVGNIIAKHERTPSAMSSETEESWSPTTSPISATPSPLGLPPQYSSTKEFYPQGPPQPQPGPPGHRLDTHTPDTTGYIHTPTDYSDVRMMPPPPTPREAPYNQLVNLSPPWAPSSNVEQKPALGPLQQQVQQHLQQQQQQHLTKKKRGRPYGSKNKPKQAGEETPTSGKQMAMASEVAGASGTETGLLTTGGLGHERINGSSSGKRNRKKQNEDAAVNTVLSLDVQSTEQLAVLPFPSSLTTSGKGQKKVWGPVVHAEKDAKRHTLNYSIINVSRKSEDDKDSKKQKPTVDNHSRNLTPFRRPLTKKKLMTLCQEMDTHTRDTSWVCALCKQGSHYRALGDLFGPYYVNVESKLNSSPETGDHSFESNSRNRTQSDTRRKSDDSSGERKQRKNSQTMNEMQTNSLLNDSHEGKMAADQQQEVWFHEDCVVWSSGVYLVGNRIRNIEEVVKDSSESVCCGCKLSGANLGCLHKGCSSRFHYLCAREKGCVMDEENFSIYCVKHKKNQR